MKTNIKAYIKVFNNKFFPKQHCQLIINSLDVSKNITHTFYNDQKDLMAKMGNDPQISFLKDEKMGSIGNLIKDQWYKIIKEYITEWLNKKEKMTWYQSWNGFAFPKFITYGKDTLLKNHCDHIYSLFEDGGKPRGVPVLSIITLLNNNYSGGEIIMCGKYKYKLKPGETLVFPSNFLYPHSIKKITEGTRYSMVSWIY